MLKVLQDNGSDAVELAGRKPMIRTQHDRGEPEFAYHPLAAYVDMWRFVTIKAVEEQAIRAWNIGNRWHTIHLEQHGKTQRVFYSIADLLPESTHELYSSPFDSFYVGWVSNEEDFIRRAGADILANERSPPHDG